MVNDLDANLIDLARYREKKHFLKLYDFYAPRIKNFLIQRGANHSQAEELTQESMLSVWRNCYKFDPSIATASTWIFRIARNLWIDYLRKHKPDRLTSLDCYPETEIQMELGELERERLQEVIKTLPGQQAQLIYLVYFQGKTHRDIAELMDIPLGSVKSGLRQAFEKLRKQLGVKL